MSSRRSTVVTVAVLLLGALAPSRLRGVDEPLDVREQLDATRPEAWAMRFFAAALQSTGVGVDPRRSLGEVGVALELANVPQLSASQRTVGMHGTKTEDLNRSPLVARPRLSVGIGGGFSLVADWIPPVTLDGAKPDVATLTLERPLYESQAWRLGFRLGAGSGRVDGDFTCPRSVAAAGADPRRNPYACESASSDSERFHWKSLELGIERRLTPRVGAHVAATLWRLDGTFRAHAHWAGLDDTTRLAYVGNDWGVAGGLDWTVDPGWRLSGELFYAPLDVLRSPTDVGHSQNDPFWNLRLLVAYRLR